MGGGLSRKLRLDFRYRKIQIIVTHWFLLDVDVPTTLSEVGPATKRKNSNSRIPCRKAACHSFLAEAQILNVSDETDMPLGKETT